MAPPHHHYPQGGSTRIYVDENGYPVSASQQPPDGSERKADYVKRQRQSRNHTCHWPDCERQVPPAMWGCKPHWFALPRTLRARIWATYEIGQEINGTPSRAYIEAARAVQDWITTQQKTAREASHE